MEEDHSGTQSNDDVGLTPYNKKLKDDEKAALLAALNAIQLRVNNTSPLYSTLDTGAWSIGPLEKTQYTREDIIARATSRTNSDFATKIIPQLQDKGMLATYIKELATEIDKSTGKTKLAHIDSRLLQEVISAAANPPKTSAIINQASTWQRPQRLTAAVSVSQAEKSNSNNSLLWFSLGTFGVGGVLAFAGVMVTITKLAAATGLGSTAFPPAAAALFTLAGVALVAAIILFAIHAHQNQSKDNIFNSTTALARTAMFGA